MTRLIAFGEALVDMLSSRLGTSSAQETFTPYAGGAPANVAVACARLGVPSLFVVSRLVDARLTRGTLSAWTADEARMRESLEFATRCGAFTVTRPGSYAALPRREDLATLRG